MQEPPNFWEPPAQGFEQGSTNLPNVDLNANVPPGPQVPEHFLRPHGEALVEMAQYPPETQRAIHAYWPTIWGRHSQYTGKYVLSIPALLMHIDGVTQAALSQDTLSREERKRNLEARRAQDTARGEAVVIWQKECAARNAWIESKNKEWRDRVAARKEAVANWDKYVDEARREYQDAKATKAPPRPI
jgi:hypothetical protein